MKTAKDLNEMLMRDVLSVSEKLLPHGRKNGRNYRCGSVDGDKGQSLSVSIEGGSRGVWSDFSTGEKGDMLSLWQKCRKISFVETLDEVREYLGVEKSNLKQSFSRKKKVKPIVPPKDIAELANKGAEWLFTRGITEIGTTAYKVKEMGNSGSILVFPFISPEKKLELIKYRDISMKGNKKKIWSNEDPEYHLWGWHAIDDDAREVVICEGEIDAMSWYMNGVPALSVPQGAGGKEDIWISADFDRLLRFDTIYISMDMDEEGQKEVEPIATRLGRERCKVVNTSPYKDANDALMDGINLKSFLGAARTIDPDELTCLEDHRSAIEKEFTDECLYDGIFLPWTVLSKKKDLVMMRPGEVSVWAGINGHGKTTSLCQVTLHAMHQDYVTCTASMETPVKKLGKKMVQQLVGNDRPSPYEFDKSFEFLANKSFAIDSFGTAKATSILETFKYAHKRYGASFFIIDSLSKCGFNEDDYSGQKNFIDKITEFAKEFSVHVVVVMHVRKGQDEGDKPSKMSIKGTGAVTDMVSNVFIWWRNKNKGDDLYDAVLMCCKQRETGVEPSISLNFNSLSTKHYREDDEYIKYI